MTAFAYRWTADNGFAVATPAGRVAYAYPTSPFAEAAKRDPQTVARKMVAAIDNPIAARPDWHREMFARYFETRI